MTGTVGLLDLNRLGILVKWYKVEKNYMTERSGSLAKSEQECVLIGICLFFFSHVDVVFIKFIFAELHSKTSG